MVRCIQDLGIEAKIFKGDKNKPQTAHIWHINPPVAQQAKPSKPARSK